MKRDEKDELVRNELLKRAEKIVMEEGNENRVLVAWDPVGQRAVEVLHGQIGSISKSLWAALYAAEMEDHFREENNSFSSSLQEVRSNSVTAVIDRGNPYLLKGMSEFERAGFAGAFNISDENPHVFGRSVVYFATKTFRVEFNRALNFAFRMCKEFKLPLIVFAEILETKTRKDCLISLRHALETLNVVLVVVDDRNSVFNFAKHCWSHCVVTDWNPETSTAFPGGCPVICFDSNYWCLRKAGLKSDKVQEACTEMMETAMAIKSPKLSPLCKKVQEPLSDYKKLQVPSDVVFIKLDSGVNLASDWGIEAAKRCLNEFLCFVEQFNGDTKSERVLELQEGKGAWALVRHVESGSLSTFEVMQALHGRPKVPSSRKRVAFEVLVWSREKRMLWCKENVDILQEENLNVKLENDSDLVSESNDLFWQAIHKRFVVDGAIHPLLLQSYLTLIPHERKASVAKELFIKYGVNGWNFETKCSCLYELNSKVTIASLSEDHKMRIAKLLEK